MRKYRITESRLRSMIQEAVNDALSDDFQTESIQHAYAMVERGLRKMFGGQAVDGNGFDAITVDLGGDDEYSSDYGLGFRVKFEYATL